jgi:hypothetical protein
MQLGTDTEMVALDSNAMTKLIEALASIVGPPASPDRQERIALAQSFFYLPDECCFHYTPTVELEYRRISDDTKLHDHISWASTLLCQVNPPPDPEWVSIRTLQLTKFHTNSKNLDDCKVLAECEASMIKCLISDDKGFVGALRNRSPSVRLCTPLEYWQSLNIPKGYLPKRIPHPTNPLSQENWWKA